MSRTIGTVVRGVRAPIFRQGDDVVSIAADTVANALAEEGITPRDKDVVAITESVVARCQGNRGRHLPHPQPQPFLPPALRHCLRCEEDRAAPQLALR